MSCSISGKAARARHQAFRAFGAEFLDAIQGLATLKAFGQSAAYGRMLAEKARNLSSATMWVLSTGLMTRGVIDVGIAVGAAAALSLGWQRAPVDGSGHWPWSGTTVGRRSRNGRRS